MPFGRPRISIDWHQVEKLCELQCTEEEIAQFFDCSISTLYRACLRTHKVTFDEYNKRYKGLGKISLRRKMHEMAMDGNVPMLIWLSKQYLGHINEPNIQVQVNNQNVQAKVLSTEDLRDLASRYGYIDVSPKGENNATTRAIESKPIETLPSGSGLQSNPDGLIQTSNSDCGPTGTRNDSPESREDTRVRIPGYEDET